MPLDGPSRLAAIFGARTVGVHEAGCSVVHACEHGDHRARLADQRQHTASAFAVRARSTLRANAASVRAHADHVIAREGRRQTSISSAAIVVRATRGRARALPLGVDFIGADLEPGAIGVLATDRGDVIALRAGRCTEISAYDRLALDALDEPIGAAHEPARRLRTRLQDDAGRITRRHAAHHERARIFACPGIRLSARWRLTRTPERHRGQQRDASEPKKSPAHPAIMETAWKPSQAAAYTQREYGARSRFSTARRRRRPSLCAGRPRRRTPAVRSGQSASAR